MSENDPKDCMGDGILMDDIFKNYHGCRNCKYQPAPLIMCDWGYNSDTVQIICKRWEEIYDSKGIN